MKIVICPDKASGVGIGHLKRCEAILEYLKDQYNVNYHPLDFIHFIPPDLSGSLVVLDTHHEISHFVTALKTNNNKVIVLDNFNDDKRDLGINIFDHHDVDRSKTVTSFDHIILRKEIFPYAKMDRLTGDYAVVTIGGGDRLGMGAQVVQSLRKIYNKRIILVQRQEAIPVQLGAEDLEILYNPPNFLELIFRSELVLCNAGSTLFEALMLKKKCLVFPQTQYELNIANYFDKNGHLLGVGIENLTAGLEQRGDLNFEQLPFSGKGAEVVGKFIRGFCER